MITINGRKMGKSYNNVIKLTEMFSGDHPLLGKSLSPDDDPVFYFANTLPQHTDFSNEALQAAEKGLKRLWEAYENLNKLRAMSNELELKQVMRNLMPGFRN